MDPMTAGRKIRLHVEFLERMEEKEGALHICYDCFNYTETPILWYRDFRFYPYCANCMQSYFQPIKIEVDYIHKKRRHDCTRDGSRS